ncbi:unnamed protein product [Adineta steineri]|uniref:Caspase-8 n=1 Tax=Adineta steineri TaxID=433720 RepID=A0A819SGS4_9BILA|nr:unnamed protein product [Adineta steineri]
MSDITNEFIEKCALILGQFDSKSVDLLVTLYHHQDASAQLINSPNKLKEKFENLLTTKQDNNEKHNDTPITRIELATIMHFKKKYLSETIIDNDNNQLKTNMKFSIDDQLNYAYCALLALINDRLSVDKHLSDLKFLLNIKSPVQTLLDIYKGLCQKFPDFFSSLINCQYFAKNLVIIDETIRKFQLFIERYNDFLITFEKSYRLSSHNGYNYVQHDAISKQNNAQETSSSNSAPIKPSTSTKQSSNVTSDAGRQRLISSPSSSNIPQKGLCIIINIEQFTPSAFYAASKPRAGSDKDVEMIKVVFEKLSFTILESRVDFTKKDFDRAFDHIDDKNEFGNFDCFVMFIMSHGLLHSFLTADSQEIFIRDIIKRYSDSSVTTIWSGKPRLFFIQACRDDRPRNAQNSNIREVEQHDLSPRMLVAYSCSPSQPSKRSPETGSIFVQIFCIMLLHYGHMLSIQCILDWTAKYVTKRDIIVRNSGKEISIQQPEFIDREFSMNFRFSSTCLYDQHPLWEQKHQKPLLVYIHIFKELGDAVHAELTSNS